VKVLKFIFVFVRSIALLVYSYILQYIIFYFCIVYKPCKMWACSKTNNNIKTVLSKKILSLDRNIYKYVYFFIKIYSCSKSH
jgi:hypothetical protein